MSDLSPRDEQDLERMYDQREAIPYEAKLGALRGTLKMSNEGMDLVGRDLERWVDQVCDELRRQGRIHDVDWAGRFCEHLMRNGGTSVAVAMLLADLGCAS